MNLLIQTWAEAKKLRRRRLPLLFFMVFLLIAAWILWCLDDLDTSRLNDVGAMLYINLLLMNTILSPVVLAAAASRMCDMEQAGNTYKWLCTMERPVHIYRGKMLVGALCVLLFALAQTLLLALLLTIYGGSVLGICTPFFMSLLVYFLALFTLQLNLSLRFSNQLSPIFISIGGTFAGLFSWFLNQLPLRYLLPWGYLAALCPAGYNYDRASRYTAYYWHPYPAVWLAVLALFFLFLYGLGRRNFCKIVEENI